MPQKHRTTNAVLVVSGSLLFAGAIFLQVVSGHRTLAVAVRLTALLLLGIFSFERRSLTVWTLYAMLVGVELGADAPSVAIQTRILGDIFLRLIRVIAAPLILGTLVTGIASHGHLKNVGRVAIKTLVYFEAITTIGLIVGAIAIDISRAGIGVVTAPTSASILPVTDGSGWSQMLLNAFPENIALAVGQNQILQIAIFSLLFGIALALLPDEKRAPMLSILQSLTETMFKFTNIIMYFAPIAAGAAIAYAVGSMGITTLLPLIKLVITYYSSLLLFFLLVLVPVMVIARIPWHRFFAAAMEPVAIGFATSSSEAALPLALENMERFGVPRWIVSFVIPAGYTFNMDGASIYLSIGAIFAAQAAGIHLSLKQQALMLVTLMLTSKGMAGVPRATLMILLATAGSLHIPAAPLLLILAVDALMDMGRTAMNVFGNCLASAVVARWENALLNYVG